MIVIATVQRLDNARAVAPIPAVVTQLGECQTEDLEVAGSSPAHRTINHSDS